MGIEITKAGMFTTVQDEGRLGWAHLGVPVSGFMDKRSAHLANWMVGNAVGDALLEITWMGVEFSCDEKCVVAIAGAEFECFVNDEGIDTDKVIQLEQGDHFKMGRLITGVRAYLAFEGSFDLPEVAGSMSTLVVAGLGGYRGRALQTGDVLTLNTRLNSVVDHKQKPLWKKIKPQSIHVIRAMPGPEFSFFDAVTIRQVFGQAYQISNESNRQGFRLHSKAIKLPENVNMSSSGLVSGSLQITPDGQTILAMKDAQTTGGYPRILVVNQDQLAQLAQIIPGEDKFQT